MKPKVSFLKTGHSAERVVAKRGIAAWIVLLCAALMGFLTLYTLTLGGIANQLANNWQTALTKSATLRIVAEESRIDGIAAAAEETLRTTSGILHFEEISHEDQLTLLEPWLGENFPVEILNLPRVYSVTISPSGIDEDALLLRLKGEAPEAIWDNHQRWRGPILQTAKRLRFLSWVSTAIIGVSFMTLIFIAAEASIAANATTIRLLRQIGATDRWIQSGFVRKFVLRSFMGAVLGVMLGMFSTFWLVNTQLRSDSLIRSVEIGTFNPFKAIIIVLIATFVGLLATRWATHRYLKRNK